MDDVIVNLPVVFWFYEMLIWGKVGRGILVVGLIDGGHYDYYTRKHIVTQRMLMILHFLFSTTCTDDSVVCVWEKQNRAVPVS